MDEVPIGKLSLSHLATCSTADLTGVHMMKASNLHCIGTPLQLPSPLLFRTRRLRTSVKVDTVEIQVVQWRMVGMALLRIPMAMFQVRQATGIMASRTWSWSPRSALHTGDGGAIEGVDAGVSLVQGASRGLGLEFVILNPSTTSLYYSPH